MQMSPSTGLDGKIGDLAFGNGRYFDGQIDELRVWNTALTKLLEIGCVEKLQSHMQTIPILQHITN